MCVNTKKGGSKAANPFGVNFHLLSGANVSPVIDVQTFLAVIVVNDCCSYSPDQNNRKSKF